MNQLIKVKDTLYLTKDQKWAIIFNTEFNQWMVFRPDEPDDDVFDLFDKFEEAAQHLESII